MLIVRSDTHPHEYAMVEDQNNALRSEFLLRNIDLACKYNPVPCFVTGPFIETLNYLTMLNLTQTPGEIRDHDVQIRGSRHAPPQFWQVKDLYLDMIGFVHRHWNTFLPDEVAAYIMWRLAWIHPFEDGNGRTSRSAGYFALCCKMGRLLPGKYTMTTFLEQNRDAYIAVLRHANTTLEQGQTDLMPLRALINEGVNHQLDTTLQR